MRNHDSLINLVIGFLGGYVLCILWLYHTEDIFALSPLNFRPWVCTAAFLLSYPWKIEGNVYSLWGGWNNGGKVYSLVEIHANAKTVNSILVFSFFTRSEKAISWIGIKFFSKASDESSVAVGVNICSVSKNMIGGIIGCNILCRSNTTIVVFGVNILSKSDDETAVIVGVNLASSAGCLLWTCVGITALSHSKDAVVTLIGIPLFCSAENALLGFGIPFLPNVRKDGKFKISFTEAKEQLPVY